MGLTFNTQYHVRSWEPNKLKFPFVPGMFTINFKREFIRCCCCLSKGWRSRHMAEYTINQQANSQRTPMKTSLRKSTSTPYVDVESDQSSSNLKSSISDRSSRYRPCTPEPRIVNENRANMNNFLCLNLPLEETQKIMTTTIEWIELILNPLIIYFPTLLKWFILLLNEY